MSQFRLVYFRPDPYIGDRFAFSAIVEHNGGTWILFKQKLPPPEYLGRGRHLLDCFIERIRTCETVPNIPLMLGPHAECGDPIELTVEDPVTWVDVHVLNRMEEP